MYGLINENRLNEIAHEVCKCLGGGGNARYLLIETCGAETGKGTISDNTLGAGMGISQIDEIPFYDIKDRVKQSDKGRLSAYFGIDIDLIEWNHIRYNPLLALIFTRLKYKKIPEEIPATLELRASYWKKHYNTTAGKGTIEHYISANIS